VVVGGVCVGEGRGGGGWGVGGGVEGSLPVVSVHLCNSRGGSASSLTAVN